MSTIPLKSFGINPNVTTVGNRNDSLSSRQLQVGSTEFRTTAARDNNLVSSITGLGKYLQQNSLSKKDIKIAQQDSKANINEIKQVSKQMTNLNSIMSQQVTISTQILSVLKAIQGMSAHATTTTAAQQQLKQNQLNQNKKQSKTMDRLNKLGIGKGASVASRAVLGKVLGGAAVVGAVGAIGYLNYNKPPDGQTQLPGYFPEDVGPGVNRPPFSGTPLKPGGQSGPSNQPGNYANPNNEQFASPIPPHMRGRMSEGIKTPDGKAIDRSQFDEQMKNPEVRAALAARAQIEVGSQPDAQKKWLESAFNRAASRFNGNLMRALDNSDGYYPRKNDEKWQEMRKNPPSKNWDTHMNDVHKKGTNTAHGATGNESENLQSNGDITASGNGERFVRYHVDKKWQPKFRDLTPEEKAEQAKQAAAKPQSTNISPNSEIPPVGDTSKAQYNRISGTGAHPSQESRNILPVETAFGKTRLHKSSAAAFQGFFDEMKNAGAPINKLGSYNVRQKRWSSGWSEHSFGNAVDIDDAVHFSPKLKKWMQDNPGKFEELKKKWGMKQGMAHDPAHVEFGGKVTAEAQQELLKRQQKLFGKAEIPQPPKKPDATRHADDWDQTKSAVQADINSGVRNADGTLNHNKLDTPRSFATPGISPPVSSADAAPVQPPAVTPPTQQLQDQAIQKESAPPAAAPAPAPTPAEPPRSDPAMRETNSESKDQFFDSKSSQNGWAPNVMNYWKQGKEGINV